MNLNPLANTVALQQGVAIGSKDFHRAGLDPYASQTGGLSPSGGDGHGAYGWNHSFLVDDDYVRACVVNVLCRPCYYEAEDRRQSGYWNAGRPDGWTPEEPNDIGSGWQKGGKRYATAGGTVTVSWCDPQHLWFDPAWDMIDAQVTTPIQVFGASVPAVTCLRWAAERWAEAVAGMLKKDGAWMAGGRASALILNFFNQASRVKLFTNKSWSEREAVLNAYLDWLESFALPQLETAPGVREVKNEGVCRWIQECGWLLPAIYEAAENFKSHANGPRFEAIGRRIARWMLDIDTVAGGKARWYNLKITSAMRKGEPNGSPLESLAGAITAQDVTGPDDYTLWSVRAADIARYYHPSQHAEAFFDSVKQKAEANAGGYQGHDKVWLVDRDRRYL